MGVWAQGGAHLLLGSGRRGEFQSQKWGKCSESLDHLKSWEVEKELSSGISQTEWEFTGSESEKFQRTLEIKEELGS